LKKEGRTRRKKNTKIMETFVDRRKHFAYMDDRYMSKLMMEVLWVFSYVKIDVVKMSCLFPRTFF
jgi:hypothetical protein